MYHRVAPIGPDPWRLAVTPERFDEQLEVLSRVAHPVSLAALLEDIQRRRVRDRSVAVTFDDGYANNLHEAAPRLVARRIPATVFVTTGQTGASHEFWWDELDQLILAPARLPDTLRLPVDGGRTWKIGAAVETQIGDSGEVNAAPGSRLALYYDIWNVLRPLPTGEKRRLLDEIAAWSGQGTVLRHTHRTMTSAEVRQFAAVDGLDVGAHTVTHALLPSLPIDAQRTEMGDSRTFLEGLLQQPVSLFSYPFGGHTDETKAAARALGFAGAVAVHPETVWSRTDPLSVPRFDVKDWDGDEFERRLESWFRQPLSPRD
jgi:peptidoglycan/xylan/chitin deacetylase (PgdA/CDA1 family)